MARILAISSQVARGHVGLSIIVPALQALGHNVVALPTVLLSNHPGHAHVSGTAIDPEILHGMLDALNANGWLTGIDAIVTGYLPTVEHVAFARRAVEQVRKANPNRHVIYLCDPVLGDDPKGLYIDERAARAIRDDLLLRADIATPNRFELSFLNSQERPFPVTSASQAIDAHLDIMATFATSIPSGDPNTTLNVMYNFGDRALTRVPLRPNAPHGTGDLFSALLLSAWLAASEQFSKANQINIGDASLAFATAGVDAVLAASLDRDHLNIQALSALQTSDLTWPIEQIGERDPDAAWVVFSPQRPGKPVR